MRSTEPVGGCRSVLATNDVKMNNYLVTVFRPNGFDHSVSLDATVRGDIDKLNDEMETAGLRIFVGGLRPTSEARSAKLCPDGTVTVGDGAYLTADSYVDGFWILSCRDIDEALVWGRNAAMACRASVEVRPFYG